MTVTDVRKDPEKHAMTIVTEFDATPGRIWRLWADPAQLSRWWGPPTWPATFVDHDLTPGEAVSYYMTGPDGEKAAGYWRVVAVDPPSRLEFEDGFADDDGNPNDALPVTIGVVTITELGGGRTQMSIQSTFPSLEAMEKVLAMGMEEGLTSALGQIDGLLAEDAA